MTPIELSHELYPFAGQQFSRPGGKLHYIDEGEGSPVVMVHGNPTWSFYFRNLARTLSVDHRVIVPDHIGCGLSDKPGDDDYDYTLASRVDDLDALLEHAGVTGDITLIVHDWGGMIGLAWAVRHPERIQRIVVMNTAGFHMPASKIFPWPLWLGRNTRLGAFLIRRMNLFSRSAARLCVKRAPLPGPVRSAYLAPYDSYENRIAVLRFVQDIPLRPGDKSYDLVTEVEAKLDAFSETPMLLCWGERDFVFDDHFLREWVRRMPHARVVRIPDAGHYVLEDAPDEVIGAVQEFLQ